MYYIYIYIYIYLYLGKQTGGRWKLVAPDSAVC